MKKRLSMSLVLGLSLLLSGQLAKAEQNMQISTNFWFLAEWTGEIPFKFGTDFTTTEDPWNPEFIAELEPYTAFRFMDWNRTNGSKQVDWDDRRQKRDPVQRAGTSDNPKAVAYEWMIDLSNKTGKDCWLTVPHQATEDYITQLADLVYNELDPSLKVFIEWSNETWNTGFDQTHYSREKGAEMGFTGNDTSVGAQYHAYSAMKIFEIFENRFAGEEHRVVKVLAGQIGNRTIPAAMFRFLEDPENNPRGIRADAFAVAAYFGNNVESDIDGLRADVDPRIQDVKDVSDYVKRKGVAMITYEGGQHLTSGADIVSRDPEVYDIYTDFMDKLSPLVSMFCHYTHCGDWSGGGSWGAKEFTGQPLEDAHKYRALVDWAENNPYAPDPLEIVNDDLPEAEVGTAYSELLECDGGLLGKSWHLSAGTLPDGMELDRYYLSGTPTEGGTFEFTLRVTDGVDTATKAMSLTVAGGSAPEVSPWNDIPGEGAKFTGEGEIGYIDDSAFPFIYSFALESLTGDGWVYIIPQASYAGGWWSYSYGGQFWYWMAYQANGYVYGFGEGAFNGWFQMYP